MFINKKLIATLGLASVVSIVALTSMKPQQQKEEGFKNLKVLPKNISHEQLESVMHEWSASLGVRCDFCHAHNDATKHMDFVSDAKPEKKMAREMFEMMNKINKKYFEAKKDSTGMIAHSGVNCYSCHRGNSHPEVTLPPRRGPGGPPPAPASPAPGGAPQGGAPKQ